MQVTTTTAFAVPAGAVPFICESPVYQVARKKSQLIKITVTGSSASFTDIGTGPNAKWNAGYGYNQQDSFVYGVKQSGTNLQMVDGAGTFYDLGTVAGMGTAKGGYSGDILPDGTMLFRNNQGKIMRLDLTSTPYTIGSTFSLTGPASGASFADMAYNPIDGKMYAIDHIANRAFYFDPITGATTYFGGTTLTGGYGATWFDEDGYFYAYDNASNQFFIIDAGVLGSGTGAATYIATSPVDEGGTNDGASCRGPALLPLQDRGDAPASYGDPTHRVPIVATVYLGNIYPDIDSVAKNTANGGTDGLGDDNDGNDDEDGVAFSTLIRGQAGTATVAVKGNGYLQGWIDWNNDGVFSATERVANNLQDSDNDGIISVPLAVPATASVTQTIARFRWSSDSGIGHDGDASDGEVEDYLVDILPQVYLTLVKTVVNDNGGTAVPSDWVIRAIGSTNTVSGVSGTASVSNVFVSPGSYTLSELGSSNYIRTSLSCDGGTLNGDSLTLADGDNVTCTFVNNDQPNPTSCGVLDYQQIKPSDIGFAANAVQNGINGTYDISSLYGLTAGKIVLNLSNAAIRNNRFTVSSSQAGTWSVTNAGYPLYWRISHDPELDGNSLRDGFTALDGILYSPGNGFGSGYYYGAINNGQLHYFAEASPATTTRTAPFTWDSHQPATQFRVTTTQNNVLENDYDISAALCQEEDWGDAPTASTGYGHARHIIDNTVYLGSTPPDADGNTQGAYNADGDDNDGIDDEDGISSFPLLLNTSTSYSLTVSCSSTASTVSGWIDFNNNGSFDTTERNANYPVNCAGGSAILNWTSLIGITPSQTYVRIRNATNPADVANPTGSAANGEVEDYNLAIADQTVSQPPNGACIAEGGNITSGNLIISFDNGTFGTENGGATQSPSADPYPGTISGPGYIQYKSRTTALPFNTPTAGQFSYVANVITARNALQHEPVVDPVYGMAGRFLIADPDTAPAKLTFTVSSLQANQQYEYSFWAANPQINGAANEIQITVNGVTAFSTGPLNPVGSGLPWQHYSFTFSTGTSGSASFILEGLQTNGPGNDFYLDNMELNACDFLNDFGDAPASYGDAQHIGPIVPTVFLGSLIDEETGSQNAANGGTDGSGDDANGTDDEDSIASLPPIKTADPYYRINSSVTNSSGTAATVVAWIDFDRNGTFDPDEATVRSVPTGSAASNLILQWSTIPTDIQTGPSYLRIRVTSKGLSTAEPANEKRDGEVEDYPITIEDTLSISGRVFHDDNVNGTADAGEAGIENVTVVLFDTASATCRSVKTSGNGDYHFSPVDPGSYQLYEAGNEQVPVPASCNPANASDPAGHQSSTGNVTGLIALSSTSISGQNFGDIRSPRFEPNHQGQILPGNVVFYAHTFSSPIDGTVAFTSTSAGGTGSWSHLMYQDSNCDGILNGSEAAAPISASLPVSAGNQLCIINKVYAGVNVPTSDREIQVITATLSTGSAITPSISRTVKDTTIAQQTQQAPDVTGASRLQLRKTVKNLSQNTAETANSNAAKPGDTLRYTIYYRNTGTGPIDSVLVKDSVPAFTTFQAGSQLCNPTPASLSCTPSAVGGALEWQFSGSLAGGKDGAVSYEVILAQ